MAAQQVPNDAEGKAFVTKLNRFRARLNANEKQMLDALVAAARQAHEQGDVEVYWFTSPGSGLSAGTLGSYGVYSGTATYSGMTR
jgi:enoyl-CoA hydratase/carnithine racemase